MFKQAHTLPVWAFLIFMDGSIMVECPKVGRRLVLLLPGKMLFAFYPKTKAFRLCRVDAFAILGNPFRANLLITLPVDVFNHQTRITATGTEPSPRTITRLVFQTENPEVQAPGFFLLCRCSSFHKVLNQGLKRD